MNFDYVEWYMNHNVCLSNIKLETYTSSTLLNLPYLSQNLVNIDWGHGLSHPEYHHRRRVTVTCINKLGHRGSDNDLSLIKVQYCGSRKWIEKCRLKNGGHFISTSVCNMTATTHRGQGVYHWLCRCLKHKLKFTNICLFAFLYIWWYSTMN